MAKRREEDAPPGGAGMDADIQRLHDAAADIFVLLTSFASFDDETIPELSRACNKAIRGYGLQGYTVEKTILPKDISITDTLQDKGSEIRTKAQIQSKNFMREKKPLDFKNLKVFAIDSEKVFWGQGTALTQPGQDAMKMLVKYFLNMPGRIVISENGPGGNSSLGMERAMMVMEYFAAGGINKNRLNISASPTTKDIHSARKLQITLLERSAYE